MPVILITHQVSRTSPHTHKGPTMIYWLRKHKFEAHLTSFTLMVLASVGLYLAANAGMVVLIWVLLSVFVLANFLAMVTK